MPDPKSSISAVAGSGMAELLARVAAREVGRAVGAMTNYAKADKEQKDRCDKCGQDKDDCTCDEED